MSQLTEIKLKFKREAYVDAQLFELEKGARLGIDYSLYDNPQYDWYQMKEIRKGLETSVDASLYANIKYDFLHMREFRKGLAVGIDLFPYYNSGFQTSVLREIRKAKEKGIDLISYAIEGYDSEQLEQITKAIEDGIKLANKIDVNVSGSQMEQLRLGLKHHVDILTYSNLEYNWMQMREVRLGLEMGVDVLWYTNILFSWRQMREIRMGLIAKLPVERYAKFILGYTDMRKAREWMLQEGTDIFASNIELPNETRCMENKGSIRVSDDQMHAFITIKTPKGNKKCKLEDIVLALKENGIKLGINQEKIKEIFDKELYEKEIEIASGKDIEQGKDGSYHFLVETEVSQKPKLLQDGSVDYQNIDLFATVQEGDVIATYEPATTGIYGYKVSGEMMQPKRGKDLPQLRGKGVEVFKDGKEFVALLSGRIEKSAYHINIITGYTHEGDLTASSGNIIFNGDIQIRGDVSDNVVIQTSKNIEILGNVGAAVLKAGGNILIRGGVNANDEGIIEAGGIVSGKFFERATIFAKKDIHCNYILNSKIRTEEAVIVSGNKGSIIGGKIEAIRGVTSCTIGNVSEIVTQIEIGKNALYVELIQELDREIKVKQEKLEKIAHKIKAMQLKYKKEELVQIPVYSKMLQWIALRHEELVKAIQNKETYIRRYRIQEPHIQVLVKGTLHPRTIIQINFNSIKIEKAYTNANVKMDEGKVKVYGYE